MNTHFLLAGGITASHRKMKDFSSLCKDRGVGFTAVPLSGHPDNERQTLNGKTQRLVQQEKQLTEEALRVAENPMSSENDIERANKAAQRVRAKILAQFSAVDWENDVMAEYRTLAEREDVDRIIMLGHSMGAYLSIRAALKGGNTEKLAAVAMISTPFEGELNKGYARSLKLANLGRIPLLRSYQASKKGEPGSNQYIALSSLWELVQEIRMGMACLPYVTFPILLFNFEEDPFREAGKCGHHLGSPS